MARVTFGEAGFPPARFQTQYILSIIAPTYSDRSKQKPMAKSISEEEHMLAASYVLGNLTGSEIDRFEAALADNPELQAEVDALQSAYDTLPQGLPPVTPPPDLKSKIIESFAAESFAPKNL